MANISYNLRSLNQECQIVLFLSFLSSWLLHKPLHGLNFKGKKGELSQSSQPPKCCNLFHGLNLNMIDDFVINLVANKSRKLRSLNQKNEIISFLSLLSFWLFLGPYVALLLRRTMVSIGNLLSHHNVRVVIQAMA